MNLAYDYPVLGFFWTAMWLLLWVLWIFLVIRIIMDIFRDDGLNGWAKAGWLACVVVLPFIGVLVYVIARGKDMGRREHQHARARKQSFDAHIRRSAGTGPASEVEQLAKLSEIHARGDISDEEFRQVKELILR
ncbi:SHOCT domain-containing protein [Streptomyces sp. NPDC002577]